MSKRITIRHLNGLCDTLNTITGNKQEPWSKDNQGKYKANIGTFYISQAYGGYELNQMCTDGGGVSCPLGSYHRPARQLYNEMRAYIQGIEHGKNI